jgi:hypothetical protein
VKKERLPGGLALSDFSHARCPDEHAFDAGL